MKRLLTILTTCVVMQFACAQDDAQIETIKISDSLYMLEGPGGNIGVSVGEDGVFMIDDKFAPLSEKIQEAVSKISGKPIEFVFNTHWHFDHTGGNENFGKSGSTIVAHHNVRERMSSDQIMKAFNREVPAAPPVALPVITFDQGMTFYFNNDEIRVVHVPRGHTDGDALLHFVNGNVIHTGDLVFNGSYPFIDTQSGGTLAGVIAAAELIISMSDDKTRIIPGHGKLATVADIREYHEMLTTVRDRLRVYLEEGLSLMAISTRDPLEDFNEKWGQGFMTPDVWLKIIYEDMATK